jgi:beta-galactosidase
MQSDATERLFFADARVKSPATGAPASRVFTTSFGLFGIAFASPYLHFVGMNSARCLQRLLVAAVSMTLTSTVFAATNSPREHLSLDANWKFHLGDDWPNALRLDKAGASGGPAAEKFNDNSWRTVNLPHDWAVELPFDKNADTSHGFKPVGPGFPNNNIGWYRRTFELPQEDSGKRISLTFDGVFRDATVWVNGWLVTRHEGGYYPFREDITDIAHFGGKNTVTVKVDASKFEGWFYEGAGIYRHVWLDKTAPVAIAPDGIFVYSKFKNNRPEGMAEICVQTELKNSETNSVGSTVNCEIISPDGNSIGKTSQTSGLKPQADGQIKSSFFLFPKNDEIDFTTTAGQTAVSHTPKLWSPEDPELYKLITTVEVDGKIIDRKETEFGIRTFAFDKDKGFLLNGQPYVLKGTCNHQDMAGVGAALPDALQYFRIAKLKEFGDNALRTSHNPPTPELLEACDHLGMIVMDESRLLGSDRENLQKWDDQIRRDRNHASVGIWSVANEEFSVQSTPQGGNVARTMQDYVKRLDPTRPVTYAAPVGDTFAGINGVIEVRGWNYHVGPDMDKYHAEHPDQPEVGTEQASTVSTRGIYENDKERGYVSAYDVNITSWSQTAETWWSYFADRPWLGGGFVWTGFDYRGEPTPYAWPCVNSHFGILDVCGFPKDNFYYYQSWWTTNTVLHLLPHWNWAGKEGQEIRVDALSNCKQVELFLNGQSLGKQAMKLNSHLTWNVKYAPGMLSAKGFDDAGKVIAETKVETTGEPAAVQLTPDRAMIKADGEDVSVITVSVTDAQGRIVPVAGNKINFALEGAGKIIGVGNGDPSCHEPDTYIVQRAVKSIPVSDWRWKLADVPHKGSLVPEYANDIDDSGWNVMKPKADIDFVLSEGQSGVFRAHVRLTEADLANPAVMVRFGGIDDHGWIFVNNQYVGDSSDWAAQPAFEIKKALHAGDNVIAVGVFNESSNGGLNPNVNVELIGQPLAVDWSRSVFNGLAQIMVQSSKDAGEIKLTASADGLKPVTTTITTQAAAARPSVP